jgi:hypothetical protein
MAAFARICTTAATAMTMAGKRVSARAASLLEFMPKLSKARQDEQGRDARPTGEDARHVPMKDSA